MKFFIYPAVHVHFLFPDHTCYFVPDIVIGPPSSMSESF